MLQTQIHKRINFNFEGQKLIFDTSRELFSYAFVDQGTRELLNSLRKNPKIKYENILDLGCGYGIIGIFLKKLYPNSEVHVTDRDSLAIDFTKHNAKLNDVEINAYSSLDFEAFRGHPAGKKIKDKFNLILTNFPAKLEKAGLQNFIFQSSQHLEKNGTLAIVVVKELKEEIEEILKNENIEIQFKDFSQGYCVYHLQFKRELSSKEDYVKNDLEFQIEDKIYKIKTAQSLREFDSIHFITELLGELISKQKTQKEVFIQEPNNGHLVLLALHFIKPEKINLVSKDLLSLKFSKENLEQNNFSNIETINSDFPQNKGDLLIWSIHDEDDKTISEKLKIYRKNFKKILLGGRLPVLKRIVKRDNIKVQSQVEKNGYVAAEI